MAQTLTLTIERDTEAIVVSDNIGLAYGDGETLRDAIISWLDDVAMRADDAVGEYAELRTLPIENKPEVAQPVAVHWEPGRVVGRVDSPAFVLEEE